MLQNKTFLVDKSLSKCYTLLEIDWHLLIVAIGLRSVLCTLNTYKMKILVIDDSSNHQESAKTQLSNHETIVVGSYDDGLELLQNKNGFDVVLVDLLMPGSRKGQNDIGKEIAKQELPVGIFLALLAAKNGAKHVAVFTDSNHHSHPASACFDVFNPQGEIKPQPLMVEGAKLFLCNSRNWVNHFNPENLAEMLSFEDWYVAKKPSVEAKSWDALFAYILK